jgi:dihydroflavonol-4-reductase
MGDVLDKNSILEGMAGCDWVINLANLYSYWEPEIQLFRDINIKGTKNVMESALETGISKVLHVSSIVVFGKPAVIPFNEQTPFGPIRFSEYARTKYEGELIARDLHRNKGLPLVIIYPGAVLGTGDTKFSGDIIRRMVNREMPTRAFDHSVITYVHVRDVCEAILRALEKEDNIGESYIICKDELSSLEVCKMVSEISGTPMPKICPPDFVVMLNAMFLTLLADVTKKPPIWGMSVDGMRVLKEGFRADGRKAEKELGITYTPVRAAMEEMIASFKS